MISPMTPSELEARFAKYDERIAALEDSREADTWVLRALIGSHPNLGDLLKLVRRTMQSMRERLANGGPDASCERVLSQLADTEEVILKVIAIRQRTARSQSESVKQQAQTQQRVRQEQEHEPEPER